MPVNLDQSRRRAKKCANEIFSYSLSKIPVLFKSIILLIFFSAFVPVHLLVHL